ncbi:MAG: hypothetical protein K2N47_04530 [Clostridia bacterium]|nr:hypothetical protein [Clostridia bacterium]
MLNQILGLMPPEPDYTGYYIGIAIEAVIIVFAVLALVLILTGSVTKVTEKVKQYIIVIKERKAAKPATQENVLLLTQTSGIEPEPVYAEAAVAEEVYEEEFEEQPKKGRKKKDEDAELLADDEPIEPTRNAAASDDDEGGEDGVIFNEKKTIMELYEELSKEQQSFFDELREEALTKPDAELSVTKNYVSVKIGKRNLIKLLIKRGVTVAEFLLENEALKQFRLSNRNKKGKSSIKIKPTVVQVVDLPSLKVAVDMISLAYEEMMED